MSSARQYTIGVSIQPAIESEVILRVEHTGVTECGKRTARPKTCAPLVIVISLSFEISYDFDVVLKTHDCKSFADGQTDFAAFYGIILPRRNIVAENTNRPISK